MSTPPTRPPPPSTGGVSTTPPDSTTETCECPCATAAITSQTIATSPANRQRTTIGAGEEVTLTYSLGSATWSSSNAAVAALSSTSGSSVTLTAKDVAGSVTITAVGGGCTKTIAFSVVVPSGWTMIRTPGTNLGHHQVGRPHCAWFGQMSIHPDNVNFYRIQTRELNSTIVVSGSYSPFVNAKHQPATQTESAFFGVVSHTDAGGSVAGMADNINTGDPGAAATGSAVPFTVGQHSFPITWQWQVLGLAGIHDFPLQQQTANILTTGQCVSRKGGNPESTLFSDPVSQRTPTNP